MDAGRVAFELTGRGQRSELEPDLPTVQEGDQHDVTFSVRLGRDFPTQASGRQVIARWENDSPGAAPLDLRVRDGQLVLHGGGGHPSGRRTFEQSLGPAPTAHWCEVSLRVCFSANPDKAHVSAWRDGESVLHDHHPPGGTLYPGQQSYLKVGLHRDPTISHPAAVEFRDLRVAQVHAAQPEHRSSGTTSEHPTTSAAKPTTPSRSTSQDRSASSSAPQHHATDSRTSLRTTSTGGVPRNTPSSMTTTRGAAQHGASDHGATQHGASQHGASKGSRQ